MVLFGNTIAFDLGVIVSAFCFAVYSFLVWSRNKWSQKGIPISDPGPFFGNIGDLMFQRKSLHELVRDFYLKNKNKPYVTFFAFSQPIVMIDDMDLVKNILIKDFQVFSDRHLGVSPKDPMEYWNMFASKGEFWKNIRQGLSPTFTSGKLKKMFELINACGKEFVTYLEKEIDENGDVVIKEANARYTSDIITSTAFGVEGDAMKNKESEFRKYMRLTFEPSLLQGITGFLAFFYPAVIKKFDLVLTNTKVTEFIRKTVWETVEYREKNKVKRNDFLDLMLQLRSKGYIEDDNSEVPKDRVFQKGKLKFDGDVFAAQCFLFMGAGFETSSTTMTWALYELALQPSLQERAYEEIERVLEEHDGEVTYEAIQKMDFLHCVVQEALRKYPVLPLLDRETIRPYKIPGTNIILEKGQAVMIPVSGIHHDPDIYPEPEKFDPERFSQENVQNRPACSFLGFGDGPRNCIGMRMGLLQTKVGLVYLLKNFSVKTCERTPIPIVYDKIATFISSDKDIFLRLVKRT